MAYKVVITESAYQDVDDILAFIGLLFESLRDSLLNSRHGFF